jgi:hypothetical protein
MAGICGYWKTDGDTPRSTLLDDMLAGLAVPADRRVDRHVDPAGRYALGSASLGVLSQASQPAMLRNG